MVNTWEHGVDSEQNVVLISIASVVDPSLAPKGKHTLHAYLPATEPFEIWQDMKQGTPEYEQLKKERSQVLWKAVERVIPDIKKRTEIEMVCRAFSPGAVSVTCAPCRCLSVLCVLPGVVSVFNVAQCLSCFRSFRVVLQSLTKGSHGCWICQCYPWFSRVSLAEHHIDLRMGQEVSHIHLHMRTLCLENCLACKPPLAAGELAFTLCCIQAGTPLTHRHFLRRHRGTYGPGIKAGEGTFPFQKTDIPGLLCCGDSTFPGIGLPAVAASGAVAANSLVPIWDHLKMLESAGV